MKRVFSLLTAVLLVVALLCAPTLAVVDQSEDFYAADYANVLTSSVKNDIISYNGALEQQCRGAQVVVVTVNYLDGMDAEQYSAQVFNDWGIGSADYDNGVLLLLAVEENKYYVYYGLGLSGTSFETEVGGKMGEFEDLFDAGEYNEAVSYIFGEICEWYDSEYDSAVAAGPNAVYESDNYNNGYNYSSGFFSTYSIISVLIRLFVIYIFISAIFRSIRRSHYSRTGDWLPMFLFFGPRRPYYGYHPPRPHDPHHRHNDRDDWNHRGGGGFGGGGFGGGGFGGGMGRGGGGFGGGGFGRK